MWITKYKVRDTFSLIIQDNKFEFLEGSFIYRAYHENYCGIPMDCIFIAENGKLKKLGIFDAGCSIINNCTNLGLI